MNTSSRFPNLLRQGLLVCTLSLAVGCGSKVAGTYSDPTGSLTLELKSGGNANLTFLGQTQACKYATSGQSISLTCSNDAAPLQLAINNDGSLTGPPGSFVPMLQKKK
jgi:hypothetical protein